MLSATFGFIMAAISFIYACIKGLGTFSKKHFDKEMNKFYIGNY